MKWTDCETKHAIWLTLISGIVVLICLGTWNNTSRVEAAHDSRLDILERDKSATEVKYQFISDTLKRIEEKLDKKKDKENGEAVYR